MSNILTQLELDGLRKDFDEILGIFDEDGVETITKAQTLVSITRVIDRGDINPTTGEYDNPSIQAIYSGPSNFSPVVFRRDRQEIGGLESVRIRQYRGIVPWDAGDILLGDFYRVDSSVDPNVTGRVFDITDVLYEAELSIRRLTMVDTTQDASLTGVANC